MSGLTVGYLSIDDLVMELRMKSGTEEEKKYANQVLPILANRHWLLVTLLLMNSIAMEALPVFLDRIVNRFWAVVISVTLILVVGEILPQAVCTGPNQVQIAAYVAPMTKFLMLISWPLSYWLGKALDIILGEHHKSRYENSDLKTLVELHTYDALKKLQEEEEKHQHIPKDEIPKPSDKMGLEEVEANLMMSALEIREKQVIDLMISFKKVFSIDFDDKLDKTKITEIIEKGYSRIPIYANKNPNDVIGLMRIKQLIGLDLEQGKSLRELHIHLKTPIIIPPSMTLIDLLREFRKGKSHMAFITEKVEALQNKLGLNRANSLIESKFFSSKGDLGIIVLGIITLEDLIEHIFNLEIISEEQYEQLRKQKMTLPPNQRSNSRINVYLSKDLTQNEIAIQEGIKMKNIKENLLNSNK